MQNLRRAFLLFLAAALLPLAARAQLTIDVIGGAGTTIPIAIVPFEGEAGFPLGITGIIGRRPAALRALPSRRHRRHRRVRRARRTCASATGVHAARMPWWWARCGRSATAASRSASRSSTPRSSRCSRARSTRSTPPQFRATAHRIADVIYEKLTGDAGRLLDAHRLHHQAGPALRAAWSPTPTATIRSTIVASNEPLLSPRWSPDGTRIAYVSFEQKKPVVYVQSLATGGARRWRTSAAATARPRGRRTAAASRSRSRATAARSSTS